MPRRRKGCSLAAPWSLRSLRSTSSRTLLPTCGPTQRWSDTGLTGLHMGGNHDFCHQPILTFSQLNFFHSQVDQVAAMVAMWRNGGRGDPLRFLWHFLSPAQSASYISSCITKCATAVELETNSKELVADVVNSIASSRYYSMFRI